MNWNNQNQASGAMIKQFSLQQNDHCDNLSHWWSCISVMAASVQVAHNFIRSGSTSPAVGVPSSSSVSASPQQNHPHQVVPNKTTSMATTQQVSPNSNNINNGNGMMATNYEGITALMLACQQGRTEDVQKLLRRKVRAKHSLNFDTINANLSQSNQYKNH